MLHHCLVQRCRCPHGEGGKCHPCAEATALVVEHRQCAHNKKNTWCVVSEQVLLYMPMRGLRVSGVDEASKPPFVNFIWMNKCGLYAKTDMIFDGFFLFC